MRFCEFPHAFNHDKLPALLGGTPVRPAGPPPWPPADPDVLEALQAAYANGSWGTYHGPHVPALEERLRAYHGVAFALTCASGTFAVELALRALKIGPGDEVILAAYDYSGNFLTVHAVGAQPVLVDVDPSNWNLTPQYLAEAIGSTTRAILVSHLHGGIVPMREVMAVAAKHGLPVIEDAAQAPGAMIQGRRAGSWGDVGILSFGGSKLLSAGRGGALLTPHADVHQRARLCCFRGNLTSPLSELQAAVLLAPARQAGRVRQCPRAQWPALPWLMAAFATCRVYESSRTRSARARQPITRWDFDSTRRSLAWPGSSSSKP